MQKGRFAVKEIKIQRLPATRSPAPQSRPRQTKDGAPIVERLEQLARELYEWSRRPDRTLPALPEISSEGFLRQYASSFDLQDYRRRLYDVMQAMFPPAQMLFVADPARCFESRCSEVMIRRKPVEERVYWKREIVSVKKGVWLPGYRGPIDTDGWHADPLRPVYEYVLSIATAYLFTSVANELKYPAALFYAAPGWPLAIRIR